MTTIVLIDSGNTRLKVGVVDVAAKDVGSVADRNAGNRALHATGGNSRNSADIGGPGAARGDWSGHIQAHALDNDDIQSLRDWLATLPSSPTAALGTNVAGDARATAIEAALARICCPMRWIMPQAQAYGLTSRYTHPGQLGADRWVSMLGVLARRDAVMRSSAGTSGGSGALAATVAGTGSARHHQPMEDRPPSVSAVPPFLLASFGTATTLDTVSGDNIFEGGLILPGPALMRRSLASGTANLPLAQGDATAYPTDTQQAISSGVAAAQAGAVLRQWLAGLRRYGDAPHIYAAGGGWEEIQAETRRLLADAAAAMGSLPPTITVIENPVLHGLARIAATTNPD